MTLTRHFKLPASRWPICERLLRPCWGLTHPAIRSRTGGGVRVSPAHETLLRSYRSQPSSTLGNRCQHHPGCRCADGVPNCIAVDLYDNTKPRVIDHGYTFAVTTWDYNPDYAVTQNFTSISGKCRRGFRHDTFPRSVPLQHDLRSSTMLQGGVAHSFSNLEHGETPRLGCPGSTPAQLAK